MRIEIFANYLYNNWTFTKTTLWSIWSSFQKKKSVVSVTLSPRFTSGDRTTSTQWMEGGPQSWCGHRG
jgi:hypothetical protein